MIERSYNDIDLKNTDSGGDFTLFGSDFVLTSGLRNNIYLCMFGGNVAATTDREVLAGEQRFDYWGNQLFYAGKPDKQFNSRTELALRDNAVSSRGRSNIEAAVIKDLQALTAVATVEATVTVIGVDKLQIFVSVTEKETDITEEFRYIWDAARIEENEIELIPEPVPPILNVWQDGQLNNFTDGLGNKFTFEI